MRLFKKLDIYILRSFLQLLAGAFFICLFVFLMQFTWRYTNDLIGKGLSGMVLAKFFYYASLTLVPMALPLSLLLASLITFGNMGEKLELLSMKAAGIPLLRILRPIFIVVLLFSGASFYFQNRIGPYATQELARLVWSMKQKSPELEIPEGTFYDQLPGYNIFVEEKDGETGMLYGVMIYIVEGWDDVVITLADSARMQSTADKQHLRLTLYSGERFRNMDQQQTGAMHASMPYMRETFQHETDYIAFADSFSLMDASLFSSNAATKDLTAIRRGIDSLTSVLDSVGQNMYAQNRTTYMARGLSSGRPDSAALVKHTAQHPLAFDSLQLALDEATRTEAFRAALTRCQQAAGDYEFRRLMTDDYQTAFRQHWVELFNKFSLSVACLVFFLIGAPLGAIIRKGGLGLPVVVSVLIFIFYYILNVSGTKMAKQGDWPLVLGVWLSTIVLLPIGVWLTTKANKDSTMFNTEGYRKLFAHIFGLREQRHIGRKEVVIYDPDYVAILPRLEELIASCARYADTAHLRRAPSYRRIFFHYMRDTRVLTINARLEQIVEELSNTRDNAILRLIDEYPILVPDAHTRPTHSSSLNRLMGLCLPLGLLIYLRIWRFRLRLWRDMQVIRRTSVALIRHINAKLKMQNS